MNTHYLPEKDKTIIELNAVVKFRIGELLRHLTDIRGGSAYPGLNENQAMLAAYDHALEIKLVADAIYDAI